MKNALSIVLTLVMCLSLLACGTSNSASPATITDVSGNSVQMTVKEICDVFDENAARFNNLYVGATITGVGTVEKVEKVENLLEALGSSSATAYKIIMKEGWVLTVLGAAHAEAINLCKGSSICFTSRIQSVRNDSVEMFDVYGYLWNFKDLSVIEILG